MSGLSQTALNNLFDDKDLERFAQTRAKPRYFGDGAGSYLVEVVALKLIDSQNPTDFGVKKFVFEGRIVKADRARAHDGALVESTHQTGDTAAIVLALKGKYAIKDALTLAGCVLRMPPAVKLPDERIFNLVDGAKLAKMCQDDGKRFVGRRLRIEMSGTEGKDKHAGRVFYNPRFSCVDEDDDACPFPSYDALNKDGAIDKAAAAYFAKQAQIQADEDTPF
jgi:hypothetical protein